MEFGYEVFHPDVEVAADFYVRVLAFTRDGSDGSYVSVSRDGLRVGCSAAPDAPLDRRKPPHGSEIVLRVPDVDTEHERVRRSGWPIEDELRKRPWGMTDFRVFDPTGQSIRITSGQPEPRVHLMYGLAGSGKSTLARELVRDGAGVRFTLDEWMLRLRPDLTIESPEYGPAADRARDVIWSIAEQVLATGRDVVLDWNSWSVARRQWAVERAGAAGAAVVLHQLTTSADEATARANQRTTDGDGYFHEIDRHGNEHLAALLEAPIEDENITIQIH